MALHDKSLKDITIDDITDLISAQVQEDATIEYKETVPEQTGDAKREFKYDVSSFANAAGGHLILGIRENGGFPVEIVGVNVDNVDAEIRRLEEMILHGINPRIPGIGIVPVRTTEDKTVIVLRIPRSWSAPHMVSDGGTQRFYSRGATGKNLLDVEQIRSLFIGAEAIGEKIRAYRTDRLGKILVDQTPVVIVEPARLVLHLVPVETFSARTEVTIKDVDRLEVGKPIGGYFSGSWYNFDGIVVSAGNDEKSFGYLQVYRDETARSSV